ncbi:MAG: hypothetical protein KBC81_02585 [Candidatus Pacebacteria bacterium]|nr:hypothetical protein [Candidatus Paceibacterota bacterium]
MKQMKWFQSVPWVLSAVVAVFSFLVWAQGLGWDFSGIGADALFPLFGIMAFSLMWVHYAVDFIERYFDIEPAKGYLPASRVIVLVALFLHPGLLAWEQWRGGLGLPPASFFTYLGPTMGLGIKLGILAWLGFMLFELQYWYRGRPWFKWVGVASDVAMVLIVFHGAIVGGEIEIPWFHALWIFYGATLLVSIGYYYYKISRSR